MIAPQKAEVTSSSWPNSKYTPASLVYKVKGPRGDRPSSFSDAVTFEFRAWDLSYEARKKR